MQRKWPLQECKEEFARVNTTLILLIQELIPLIDSVNGDYVLDRKQEKQHISNIRKILNITYLNDE
jgi:hypothetical protein